MNLLPRMHIVAWLAVPHRCKHVTQRRLSYKCQFLQMGLTSALVTIVDDVVVDEIILLSGMECKFSYLEELKFSLWVSRSCHLS